MSLLADFNRASKHSRETVIVNSYGDTTEQVRLHSSWESDYQAYLAKYNAEHKDEINN